MNMTAAMRPLPVDFTLRVGSHATPAEGMCVMEAIAHVAGERHSDTPASACPVIGSFLRVVGDWMRGAAARTALLLPYVTRVVGTRSTREVERRRAYLLADWACRTILPLALEAAHLDDHASAMRGLDPVVDPVTAHAARDAAMAARDAVAAAYAADAAAAYAGVAAAYAGAAAADAAAAADDAGAAAAYAGADAAYAGAAAGDAVAAARDDFLAEHVPAIIERLLEVTA